MYSLRLIRLKARSSVTRTVSSTLEHTCENLTMTGEAAGQSQIVPISSHKDRKRGHAVVSLLAFTITLLKQGIKWLVGK